MNTLRIRGLAVLSAAVLCASGALAQAAQQKPEKKEESLAELARRARAERERRTTAQPVREFTNDTLPPPRFPEAATAPASEGADAPAAATSTQTAVDEGSRRKAETDLGAAREQLNALKRELELLERDHKLNAAAFYGKPDYSSDRTGAANIAAQEAAITTKKNDVAAADARVKELEAQVSSLNQQLGPRAQEPLTPEQQRGAVEERLRPLRSELSRIEAELATINQERAALGGSSSNPPGAFTGDRIAQLERRRGELQRQIADIEDDARRTGAAVRN